MIYYTSPQQLIDNYNNRPIADFEGYSAKEMNSILYYTLDDDCPIQLSKMEEADYKRIPMLNQVKYLANLIANNGEIKLTDKGYLPPKYVLDIYNQGFVKEESIESGVVKLRIERDSITINLTKILLELSKLTKKRLGKLSLTKAAEKVLTDDHALLYLLFKSFGDNFNWGYYDSYAYESIGAVAYGYSLILLSNYGDEKRLDSFYAEKYFKAFPKLIEDVIPSYDSQLNYASTIYSVRTYSRFLDYFGLINIDRTYHNYKSTKYVNKTDLFDKLVKCIPPKSIGKV